MRYRVRQERASLCACEGKPPTLLYLGILSDRLIPLVDKYIPLRPVPRGLLILRLALCDVDWFGGSLMKRTDDT